MNDEGETISEAELPTSYGRRCPEDEINEPPLRVRLGTGFGDSLFTLTVQSIDADGRRIPEYRIGLDVLEARLLARTLLEMADFFATRMSR